jgi:5-methylcytosine-specific restriction protein B
MNNKQEFKKWVLDNLTEKSGAGPAYIMSIDWLSDRFYEKNRINKKSIFEIEDIDLITELHLEVKKIQRDKNSFIYNVNAPSYGERYFYSASLSKYKEFLQFKNGGLTVERSSMKINNVEVSFDINSYNECVFESGLVFSETLITRFVASLLSKPFVLLTGLSGSGKTKIAQSFVKWICEDENQYRIIPIGADWTNREPLLGYPNGLDSKEYITPDSGTLNLIIEASKMENAEKPYFLILDEMNLSHVERYFADFLSVMESDDKISLYSGAERIDLNGNVIPKEIYWSKNLFIIGTVNIDETTYMFSPKVLDRANTIEFRVDENNIKSFFDLPSKIDLSVLLGKGVSMAKNFLQISQENQIEKNDEFTDIFIKFFNELKKVGAEFGYRIAVEMILLIKNLNTLRNLSNNESIDIAVMQKLLPKLHGSRNKLTKVLPILGGFCLKDNSNIKEVYLDKFVSNSLTEVELKTDTNIKYKISFGKICRMYKNAVENGFASYAEA